MGALLDEFREYVTELRSELASAERVLADLEQRRLSDRGRGSGTRSRTPDREENVRPARRRTKRRRTAAKSSRAPGSREAQIREALAKRRESHPQVPGLTIPELAEVMGMGANYLYRAMPRLLERGVVGVDSGDGKRRVEPGSKLEDRSDLGHNPRWWLA